MKQPTFFSKNLINAANQVPHSCLKIWLDYLVPLQHEEMDHWRDSLHHGLKSRFEESNIILSGGVDDIWLDRRNQKFVVVGQANNKNLIKVI